tara:strand:- start:92 stop:439 length:348 start_codon:yes stop_codon:yes gene_type:complete
MNPVTNTLFLVIWFGLLFWAIKTIAQGWNLFSNNSNSSTDFRFSENKRTVTKSIHPEMRDVKQGDELMVVNFGSKACDIDEYNQLQERIKELQSKLEDSMDDDDDDGDIPALLKK